jgi:hypothetical protein
MDRGYMDFARLQRLQRLTAAQAFFVVRAKNNLRVARIYSHPIDRLTGLRSDHTVRFTGYDSHARYPQQLRRVRFYDAVHERRFTFLTNAFTLPALTIAALYRQRWQIELFFKWIKQHLRIQAFYGTSANAVKTQVWTAISVYVLVAIVRRRINSPLPLFTVLQILSVSLFEKVELASLLTSANQPFVDPDFANQLPLFE